MSDSFLKQEHDLFSIREGLSVLDEEQISLLLEACESDPGFMEEVLDTFRSESLPKLDEVDTYAAERDANELRKAVHFIAGSAANTGLLRLSELCRQVESQIDEDRFSAFGVVPALVRYEHDRALVEIEKRLA